MPQNQSRLSADDLRAIAQQIEAIRAGRDPQPIPWMGPDDTRRDWLASKSRDELAVLDALIRLLLDGRLQAFYRLDAARLDAFMALFDAEDLTDLKRMLVLGRTTLHVMRFLRAAVIVVAGVVGGTVVFGQQAGAMMAWLWKIAAAAGGKP